MNSSVRSKTIGRFLAALVIASLVLSGFGTSSISAAPPPPTETATPTQEPVHDITIDFDTVASVPEYLRQWVNQALVARTSVLSNDTLFYSTAFRLSEGKDWARIVLVPSYVIESGWENVVMDDVVEILAQRQSMDNWTVRFYKDKDFPSFSQNAPPDFIDFSAVYSLAEVHRFPWTAGQSWWKNGGWHGDNPGGLPSNSIDFQPKTSSSPNIAVLAAAPGQLDTLCAPDAGGQMWLKIANSDGTAGYGHLASSTVRQDLLGQSVVGGQYLGNLFAGSSDCGTGSAPLPHLHFVFPNRNITMYDAASNRDVTANEIGIYTVTGVISYTSNNIRVDNPGGGGCGSYSYNGIVLFEHANCNRDQAGAKKEFSASTGWINLPDFNDIASSIHVASGWSVKVHEHNKEQNNGGSSRCITDSKWDLNLDYYTSGNTGLIINDSISSVEVFNNNSCTGTPQPSANFDASPQSGSAPLTVSMHIVSIANITTCAWDYGDGQTGTSCASNHNHVYNNAGTYTVQLTVTGPGGSDTMTRSNYITVSTSTPCPQSGGVILYWNANYNCGNPQDPTQLDPGYRQRTSTGWQNVNDGNFNDKASSVKVPAGWSVKLFDNADRGEPSKCFSTDIPDFGTQGNFDGSSTPINDHVSSIEVFNNSNCGTPPTAGWTSPSNGQTITSGTVHLEASVSGGSGGINRVAFSAKWNNSWAGVQTVYSSPYAYDWDLCNAGVLNGDIELGLEAWDNAGNHFVFSDHAANYHVTKNFNNCNPVTPPAAPSNLRQTGATQTSVTLTWQDDPNNEAGFKIERSPDGIGNWTQIDAVGTNMTTYTDSRLPCPTTDSYRVRAYNAGGDSGYSNAVNATTSTCSPSSPGAPSNLHQTGATQTSVTLSWQNNSNNEDGFKIERSPDGTTGWTQIDTVGANVTIYTNIGLNSGTTYYYRVRAYNTGGDSGYSNVAPATASGSATLNGHVTLQGRPPVPNDSWKIGLAITLTAPGTGTPLYPPILTTTTSSGQFTLPGIAPGTYDIWVKGSHTLRITKTLTLVSGNNPVVEMGILREGDTNNDNFVGDTDFFPLKLAFNHCQGDVVYNVHADFNQDGCVTLLDFSLLTTNYFLSGANQAQMPDIPLSGVGPSLSISPPILSVAPGQVFTVTIQVQADMQRVEAAQAHLTFNPAWVQVRKITPGVTLPTTLASNFDNQAGIVRVAAGTFGESPSGTFTLAQIEFEALTTPLSGAQAAATGTGIVPLKLESGNPQESDIASGGVSVLGRVSDGEITVGQGWRVYLPLIRRSP